MISLPTYLLAMILFSAASFLFFGFACLISPQMVVEFKRYGLAKYRVLNGFLQLVGAAALLAGLVYTPLALVGGSGLSLLMFMGLIVRIRIRDGVIKSLPALFYAVLNLCIVVLLLK